MADTRRDKHLKLDQRKIDFAKRYFGVQSEQEAIDRALSLLMEEERLLKGIKPLKGLCIHARVNTGPGQCCPRPPLDQPVAHLKGLLGPAESDKNPAFEERSAAQDDRQRHRTPEAGRGTPAKLFERAGRLDPAEPPQQFGKHLGCPHARERRTDAKVRAVPE